MPKILKIRLEQHLIKILGSKLWTQILGSPHQNFGLFALYLIIFLSTVWLSNGQLLLRKHSHSPNVNHCILVIFGAKLTGRYWASTPKWVPSKLWSQCHKPRSHSPQIAENNFARLAPSFYEMPPIPKIVIAWHYGGL